MKNITPVVNHLQKLTTPDSAMRLEYRDLQHNDLCAVEIWVPLEPDSENYPSSQRWEQLWAWPVMDGFRIDNIPFFAKHIAVGDIVTANTSEQGMLVFERVVLAGGNSTVRIWLSDTEVARSNEIQNEIRHLGGRTEVTLDRLIAIDSSPSVEEQIWEYLQRGLQAGAWDLQVACSAD